jgi:hypothetical protein
MDLDKVIAKLQGERAKLDAIIASLEQIKQAGADIPKEVLKKRRGRKFMNEADRREVSERMKRYWAARRKQKEDSSAEGANGV